MSGGEPSSIKQYVPCDMVNPFGCMLNYELKKFFGLSEVIKLYQALYRKWRPKTFDDVIGQNHVTETLKSEVMSGRISHAYLFTGCRGTGKTSCAKILAKAINCTKPPGGNPCEDCEICKNADKEKMLDISEIDAASNNGVENIRSMREEVVFSPTKCKFRVYIVDEVHMLSAGAFNAFLKVLEEPPSHVVFILATTEVHKLPATIISRCQRFDFYRISQRDIEKRIKYICKQEKIKIEEKAANIIANSADGAMRDALSILDQCANACENNITGNRVQEILGTSGSKYVFEITDCIRKGKSASCVELIDEMYKMSKSMILLCEELLEYFRNLMIFKIAGKVDYEPLKGSDWSKKSLEDILQILSLLQEAYKNINQGAKGKIEMEIALVNICTKFCGENASQKKASPSYPLKDCVESTKESSPPPPNPIKERASPLSPESSFKLWDEIIESLKKESSLKSLYISLKDSTAYQNGNYILIDSKNSLAFELLRRNEYRMAIKKIIKEVTGIPYSLGPYTAKITQEADPLDELIKSAKSSGINITLN